MPRRIWPIQVHATGPAYPICKHNLKLMFSPKTIGITAKIIAGLSKLIGSTLTKYRDPVSQQLVRDFLVALVRHHPVLAIEPLLSVLRALLTKELASAPTSAKAAQAAVLALHWCTLLTANADRSTPPAIVAQLVDTLAQLHQLAVGQPNARLRTRATELLHNCWASASADVAPAAAVAEHFTVLLGAEPSSHVILLLVAILEHAGDQQPLLLAAHKSALLEHFIKGLVAQKTKPHEQFIPACAPLLCSITREEFGAAVLAALRRAMLRSPEIVLQAVGAIVAELRFDVSDFAEELGRPLIQNLYTKDDVARSDAGSSLAQLARRCGRPAVIEGLLRQIFAVLNGADGKITVTEYRVSVLQGAGFLSENAMRPDEAAAVLSTVVVELFGRALETEIHERVLCHTLEMFGLWSRQFRGQLPSSVTDAFVRGLALRTTTPAVRVAYLQWLLACLNDSTMPHDAGGSDISAALIGTVERAGAAGATVPQVAEAVAAACLLLKTECTSERADTERLHAFWSLVLDMRRQVFVAERFLASVPPETLCYVMLMAKLLLLEHGDRFRGVDGVGPLYRALVYAMNAPSPKVRAYCVPLAGELVRSAPHGGRHARYLLEELTEYVQVAKIAEPSTATAAADETAIPAQAFVQSILTIGAVADAEDGGGPDAQMIALGALLCCHQPTVRAAEPHLWERVLRNIQLEPKSFISLNAERIRMQLIDEYRAVPIYEHAVATVARVSPEIVLPIVVRRVREQLDNPEMAAVTDDEYFTFLQSDGELYDKSVLPSDDDVYKDLSSRRENKVLIYQFIFNIFYFKWKVCEKC